MPPRRGQRQAAAAAAAAVPTSPLLALPAGVLQMVGEQLVQLDKLNSVETACRDVASLAQSCRALRRRSKKSLWTLLGRQLEGTPREAASLAAMPAGGSGARAAAAAAPAATAASLFGGMPKEVRYEAVHLSCKTQRLEKAPAAKQVAKDYEEDVPEEEVPPVVYGEVRRLRCLGVAPTNAKKEFLLTDGELKSMAHVDKSRGALGTANVYRLADLLAAARAKHGSVEGMEAAGQAKVAAAAARKRNAADAAEGRRQELAAALAGVGGTLSPALLKTDRVAAFLKGGKAAPSKESLLPFLQLASWADRHAGYGGIRQGVVESGSRWLSFKNHFREEMDDGGSYFGGGYCGAATKAAAELDEQEEEDCIRLACQLWADARGGLSAALTHPDMPPAGTSLRAAVEAALLQRIHSSIPSDLGYDMSWGDGMCDDCCEEEEEEKEEEGHGQQQGEKKEGEEEEARGQQQQLLGEEDEEEEGGAASGSGGAAGGQQVPARVAAFLKHGFAHYVQLELTAATPADPTAWQAWVRRRLRSLARSLSDFTFSDWYAEACTHPFRPPAGQTGGAGVAEGAGGGSSGGGEGTAGGAAGTLFFIGMQEKQAPSSLSDKVAAAQKGARGKGRGESGAGPSKNGRSPSDSSMQKLRDGLARQAKCWPERKEGMELRLSLLHAVQLPAWMAQLAG